MYQLATDLSEVKPRDGRDSRSRGARLRPSAARSDTTWESCSAPGCTCRASGARACDWAEGRWRATVYVDWTGQPCSTGSRAHADRHGERAVEARPDVEGNIAGERVSHPMHRGPDVSWIEVRHLWVEHGSSASSWTTIPGWRLRATAWRRRRGGRSSRRRGRRYVVTDDARGGAASELPLTPETFVRSPTAMSVASYP